MPQPGLETWFCPCSHLLQQVFFWHLSGKSPCKASACISPPGVNSFLFQSFLPGRALNLCGTHPHQSHQSLIPKMFPILILSGLSSSPQ